MGFHATINAGPDQFGNMRHKVAPRVSATDKITGSAQIRKGARLAGPVMEYEGPIGQCMDDTSTAMALAAHIASRHVTRLTETMNDWRKDGTKMVLRVRSLGGSLVARKVSTRDFKGWVVSFIPAGQKSGPVLVQVAKGTSIETNGEKQDAMRAALNTLYLAVRAS